MYKSSTRKRKIQAALSDPINQPLVTQLRSYLDDEYLKEDLLEPEHDDKFTSRNKNIEKSEPVVDTSKEDNKDDEGDTKDEGSMKVTDGKSDPSDIKSSISCCIRSSIDLDVLKGTLNAVDDTCGVLRIKVDEDKKELWIYYNDDINLNDVMTPLIELLEASNYNYLIFNRLARSGNAVVFEISSTFVDTFTTVHLTEGDKHE